MTPTSTHGAGNDGALASGQGLWVIVTFCAELDQRGMMEREGAALTRVVGVRACVREGGGCSSTDSVQGGGAGESERGPPAFAAHVNESR